MAKRSDLAQKLLTDLHQQKQQMGLAQAGNRQHDDRPRTESYASSRWSAHGSQEVSTKRNTNRPTTSAAVSRKLPNSVQHRKQTPEVASRDIVPVGRARVSEHVADLSMAIALALSKNGAQVNMEFLGNGRANAGLILQNDLVEFKGTGSRHVSDGNLLITGQFPSLSHLQIGEIAQGAQNLNMILKTYSEGLFFGKDSIEIGRMLLKGAKDLEESLKMLVTLQEPSDHTVRSHKNQAGLLKNNDDNETSSPEVERRMTSSTYRFSFDKILRFFIKNTKENKKGSILGKKQITSSHTAQQKLHQSSTSKSTSNGSKQFITNKKSTSYSSGSNCDPTSSSIGIQGTYSDHLRSNSNSTVTLTSAIEQCISSSSRIASENKKLISQGSSKREKARIPNVIAKLMGLEEIPSFKAELKESETLADSISKQGRCRIIEISEKSASLKGQQKEHQENGSKKPQSHKTLVAGKGEPHLKILHGEENSVMVLKNSNKPQSLTYKQMELVSKDQNKESRFMKEADGTRRSQNLMERQKVEHMLEEARKPCTVFYPKSAPQLVNGKNDWKEVESLKKGMLLKEQRKANKNSVLPSHESKVANDTELQKANQRSLLNFTVDSGKAVSRKETNRKSRIKSSLLVNNSRKNTQAISSQKILSNIPAIVASKTSSKDFPDKRPNIGSQKENQSKDLLDQQRQMKDARTRNQRTIYTEVYRESAKKFVEQKPLLTAAITEKQNVNSVHKASQITRSEQFPVLEKVDNKIAANTSEDPREIVEDDKSAKIQGPTLKQCIPVQCDLEEMRGASPIEEMILTTHALHKDKHLKQGADSTSTLSVTQYRVMATESNLLIEAETKLAVPKPMNDEKMIKDYGYQQLKEKSQQNNQEKHLYDFTGSQTRGSTDNEQTNNYDLVRHQDQKNSDVNSQDQLTEDEKHLMHILISNLQFLDTFQALFKLQIPVSITQDCKACKDHESKLTLDCGQEVIRRKGKIEEFMLQSPMKFSPGMSKGRSLRSLIKEIYNDIKTLKFTRETEKSECDTAEHLHRIMKEDIESTKPCVNCMWDLGWNGMIFARLEMDEVVKGTEKHIFNILLTELAIESFDIFSNKSV